MRDGAYVLPNSDRSRAVFDEQSVEIKAAGGLGHIVMFEATTPTQNESLLGLFDRTAEYAAVMQSLEVLKKKLAKLDELGARQELTSLTREVAAIVARDFFPGESRKQMEGALAEAETAINARFSPDEPSAAKPKLSHRDAKNYRDRTWATREHLWVDRVACAWLIRRFIDPAARFKFVPAKGYKPARGELRFDMYQGEFTHEGDRCSFETLLAHFGLTDPALRGLGEIVHDVDCKDGKFGRPEAAGVASLIGGLAIAYPEDAERLERGAAVFEGLYAYISSGAPSRSAD
jgi:hypothetical protein